MKRGGRRSLSLFYNYLASYLGVALLSCGLIGMLLFMHFVDEYEQSYRDTLANQAELAVVDMRAQFEALEDISYRLSGDVRYRPSYLAQSNYYEREMLEDFRKYSGSGALGDEYFLLYSGTGKIYRANVQQSLVGATYRWDVFFSGVLGIQDPETLYVNLMATEGSDIVPSENGAVLLCFPVRMPSAVPGRVLLCYSLPLQTLQARIDMVTRGLDSYALSFDGAPLLRVGGDAPLSQDEPDVLVKAFEGNRFSIAARAKPLDYMGRLFSYRSFSIVLAAVIALILVFALLLAYFRFRPIARINRRLMAEQGMARGSSNELSNIEAMLDAMIEQDQASDMRIAQQMHLLKRQAIRLLLSGDFDSTMRKRLAFLQVDLEGRWLAAALIRFAGVQGGDLEAAGDALILQIEDLSGDDLRLYGCLSRREGDIAVVVSMRERDSACDAEELIRALADAQALPVRIGVGGAYDDLHRLPASFLEATAAVTAADEGAGEAGASGRDLPLQYDRRTLNRMIGAVRLGDAQKACEALGQLIEAVGRDAASLLMQRYVYSDMLSALALVAQELEASIYPQQVSAILVAQQPQAVYDSASHLIGYLCEMSARRQGNEDQRLVARMIAYIREHALENDLSLERLATVFSLSASHISRLIKQSVGENYKDYVIRLKIEHAKACLAQGVSVTEVCERCGYVNLSHFIKTFKQVVGVTPSAFRREAETRRQEA